MIRKYTIREKIGFRKEAGEWLCQQRKAVKADNQCGHLTQQDVADNLGIESDGYISNIESGGPNLPEDRWREYADVLGIPHSDFMEKMLYWYKPELYNDLFGNREKFRPLKVKRGA